MTATTASPMIAFCIVVIGAISFKSFSSSTFRLPIAMPYLVEPGWTAFAPAVELEAVSAEPPSADSSSESSPAETDLLEDTSIVESASRFMGEPSHFVHTASKTPLPRTAVSAAEIAFCNS